MHHLDIYLILLRSLIFTMHTKQASINYISAHDFTFSTQRRGQIVPYGEAGDCYSTVNCPQGRFSINLIGTGLRVSPYTGWVGQGNQPSLWLQRISVSRHWVKDYIGIDLKLLLKHLIWFVIKSNCVFTFFRAIKYCTVNVVDTVVLAFQSHI